MKKYILICIAICLTVLVTSCGEELDDKYEYLAIKSEISVSESTVSVEGTEQSYRIQINCNSYWTATTNSNWIHLDAYGGKGKGSVYLNIDANPSSTAERKGEVNISDGIKTLKVTVTQAPIPTKITVEKTNLSFEYYGGSSTIKVESNADWTATSDAVWCTSSKTSSEITITAQGNNSYDARTATITLKATGVSVSIKISQAAPKKPTLSDVSFSNITKTSAYASFTYDSSDLSILSGGICYSSTKNSPTTSDICSEISMSNYSGTASRTLSGLTQNTTYYVRPYVVTSAGTTYGNVTQFTTLNIISPNESDNPTPDY